MDEEMPPESELECEVDEETFSTSEQEVDAEHEVHVVRTNNSSEHEFLKERPPVHGSDITINTGSVGPKHDFNGRSKVQAGIGQENNSEHEHQRIRKVSFCATSYFCLRYKSTPTV
jgi:hypothetical protein